MPVTLEAVLPGQPVAASASAADTGPPPRRSGLEALVAVARHHGLPATVERLVHDHALPAREPTPPELVRMARLLGLKARHLCLSWDKLTGLANVFPLLAQLANGNTVIVIGVRRGPGQGGGEGGGEPALAVVDPLASQPVPFFLTREQFCRQWSGERNQGAVVLLKRHYALSDREQRFGLGWFVAEVWQQRVALRDVAVAAGVLHLIALVTPLYFQLVIDKVLTHNSYSTLYVLTAGICIAIVFEGLFSFIRRYLLLAASNKIDIRLATRTFSHLVALPIDYFEQTSAGVTVRHMQQVEKIRQFLTGRMLLTALDATALLVFLPVLLLYSVDLTLIVLLFTALMALVILALVGPFRRRLRDLYEAEAQRQAMLVETIQGMRTVKAAAIEPVQRRKWDQSAANAVTMQFRVGQMGITAQAITQVLERLMTVAVIGLGTLEVFDQVLTVGALIAFQMVSNRVVSPLVQIVSLIQDYQETALSVRMLGEVMNRAPERRPGTVGLFPRFTGQLELDRVRFRYRPDGPPVLDGISVRIPAGKVIGVVGRSGSGKTTLTRLLQGFYPVQEGVIRFDGTDIREIDLAHLRRNTGVVLQENFLFRGTVRENIAITKPDASPEEIAAVARLAGADEFIEKLPQGFETLIEENAANLSGGQRQRLAIARALLPRPRLMILDEATSALDPDSEAIFMANLAGIAAGRTVIIVSHRLATLVRSDAILVLDQGRIIDAGPHPDLLQRCQVYRHLWTQQNRNL